MRTILFLVVLTLIGSALANPQSPPWGYYRRTCKNISVSAGVLNADCLIYKDRDGSEHYGQTSLKGYAHCADISNHGGKLVCMAWPLGSYLNSCENPKVSEGTLEARCWDARSNSGFTTSLENYKSCNGDIENRNGKLRCAP